MKKVAELISYFIAFALGINMWQNGDVHTSYIPLAFAVANLVLIPVCIAELVMKALADKN
jgi:hypothetical protein